LSPKVKKRDVNGTTVISFFNYSDVESLLYTKYDTIGSYVYSILAKHSFEVFAKEYTPDEKLYAIPIDDLVSNRDYSHTAILANALKSKNIEPNFYKLIAKNRVKYAKQSYEYRVLNPREFVYKGKKDRGVILVDDVLTSGLTITEAVDTLMLSGVKVEFAITLTDAREK
jgi:competence protein ComFC